MKVKWAEGEIQVSGVRAESKAEAEMVLNYPGKWLDAMIANSSRHGKSKPLLTF